MAKIRVHELAKELGRENKDVIAALQKLGVEVKSHMSNVEDTEAEKVNVLLKPNTARIKEEERMEQNPDKVTEKDSVKKSDGEGAVQPKKKNIIQVFRPQNSKTGMVKPGSRPRPQGQAGARPQGARPQGQPRPQGASGARPQGQAGARPQGQSGARPQSAAGVKTQVPASAKAAELRAEALKPENTAETVKSQVEVHAQEVKAAEVKPQ